MYGKHHSEESKKKMKNKIVTFKTKQLISLNHFNCSKENHPMYGKHHSEESKQLIKLNHASKKEKYISPLLGKLKSIQHKENIIMAAKNRPIIICIYCQKEGKGPNMKRYHFNNCKKYKKEIIND